MTTLAIRVLRAITTAGIQAVSVSIGNPADKSTWKVAPTNLQAAAQPTIDAFNPADPALDDADLDADVKAAIDNDRIFSAIVWTILDTYSAPATIAKFQTARTKIIAAYKAQPWKP